LGFYYDGTCAEAEAHRAELESIKAGWGEYIVNFLDEYRYDDGYLVFYRSYGGPPRVITIKRIEGDLLEGEFTAPADGNVWKVILQLVEGGITEFYPKTKKHIEDIRELFPEFENDADFNCRID
jgi:hypothetical protein